MKDVYMPNGGAEYVGWCDPAYEVPELQDAVLWDDPETVMWETLDLSEEDQADLNEQLASKALIDDLDDMSPDMRQRWGVQAYYESGVSFRSRVQAGTKGWDVETNNRLSEQTHAGDMDARNMLAEGQFRRLFQIAVGQPPLEHLGLDDQIQDGAVGLVKASTKYDHKKGIHPIVYTSSWTRTSVKRGRMHQERQITVGYDTLDEVEIVQRVYDMLRQEVPEFEPTPDEIREHAKEAGATDEEVDLYLSLPVAQEGLEAIERMDPSHLEAPDDEIAEAIDRVSASQILTALIADYKRRGPEINLRIVALRELMAGPKEPSFAQIGRLVGSNGPRARVGYMEGLRMLRRQPTTQEVKEQFAFATDPYRY